jgi:hypothetical protein
MGTIGAHDCPVTISDTSVIVKGRDELSYDIIRRWPSVDLDDPFYAHFRPYDSSSHRL